MAWHKQSHEYSHMYLICSTDFTMWLHVNSFSETRQSKQLRPKTTPFHSFHVHVIQYHVFGGLITRWVVMSYSTHGYPV